MRADVWLALASAACFAVSTVAQHRAAVAHAEEGTGTSPVRLVLRLARSPLWLAGLVVAVAALLLQALALSRGALVVVQPILLLGLLLALPLSDALARRLPGRGEVLAALAVLVGLALFVVAADPDRGTPVAEPGHLLAVAGGWTGVALLAALLGETVLRRRKALLLGLSGGALIGVSSALLKQVVGLLGRDPAGALLDPATAGVVLTGVAGLVATQAGYAAGHLSASQPAHSIAEPAVAAAIGATAFAEHLAAGALPLAGQVVGALLMVAGVIGIALVVPDLHEPPATGRSPQREAA
ncbi:DMT family transporter [Quadrisphaera sp. KR29]|uniref:DMT family transporter n=1 Tax=Quadrisphaera sp. KR29 TaxID=3461391 RepID=UPI004044B577